MKTEPAFRGVVSKGKVILDDPTAYCVWLAGLEGKEIELLVRRRRKNRTKSQNKYLFGVVYDIIAEHSGYESTDEVHAAMKQMFLEVKRENLPVTVKDTHSLSTVEFSEYIDKIKRWAANFLGVYVPDAGEVWE